ncbi:MAG TPA: gliding motility-associated ABC transporter permease subunit GldF [Bacteroidales bacterium]|nr:gliding motility-associated ABC transporter permease subunit GldF [Bacteroidales bacterium]
MLSIFKKELRSFFSNATGYIVIGIFLLLTGLFLWVIPGQFNVLDAGYANLDGLFYLAPWLFLFLVPAVCMRFFAEEKQTGTWELIQTKPLSTWQIVLGKYFAGLLLVVLALLPTIIYYISVSYLAQPVGNVDAGQFWGSFIGLIFLAATYTSIGIFSSSITRNQIVAFIIALVISFFMFYGFDLLSSFFSGGAETHFLENLGIHSHYKSMSRGVIDSRDLVYFLVVCGLFLFGTAIRVKRN